MKNIILFLIVSFACTFHVNACINTEGTPVTLSDGTYLYSHREGKVPRGNEFRFHEELLVTEARLDSLFRATGEFNYLSDRGVVLILLKQYAEAISLYQYIEVMKPNRYSTASNMGTAYELMGQNDSALKWIKRSVEIDPESHMGSEWLHVKILEAKIGGEQFYNTRFLLNTDFGDKVKPATTLTYVELEALSNALYYQLNERISFVEPKDKIVAQLLFDMANISFLMKDYIAAYYIYSGAQNYGYTGQLLKQRMEKVDELIQADPPIRSGLPYLTPTAFFAVLGAVLLLIVIIIIRVRRKRRRVVKA